MRIDVAAGERSQRVPKLRRIRVTAQHTIGVAAAGEEPDLDRSAPPLHRIHAPSTVVEPIPIGSLSTALRAAALIALTAFADHGAAAAGVHGHDVFGLVVDALDDVDFATVGPVGTRHPEGGPDPAGAGGHVVEIEDNEGVCVLGFARDADAVSTAAGGYVGGVRPDGHLAVGGADEAIGLSGVLVYVVDVAVGGIVFLWRRSMRIKGLVLVQRRTVSKVNMEKKLSPL